MKSHNCTMISFESFPTRAAGGRAGLGLGDTDTHELLRAFPPRVARHQSAYGLTPALRAPVWARPCTPRAPLLCRVRSGCILIGRAQARAPAHACTATPRCSLPRRAALRSLPHGQGDLRPDAPLCAVRTAGPRVLPSGGGAARTALAHEPRERPWWTRIGHGRTPRRGGAR